MISSKISYLLRFPPTIMIKKVLSQFTRKRHILRLRSWSLKEHRHIQPGDISFSPVMINLTTAELPDRKLVEYMTEKYAGHTFNHLGCPWTSAAYGAEPPGFHEFKYKDGHQFSFDAKGQWLNSLLDPAHVQYSRLLWSQILELDPTYQPINWQRDHRSGYQWRANLTAADQSDLLNTPPGADVKVPLELSRLQHLPRLAFWLVKDNVANYSLANEIKCQLLDFMMSNPIGMGVNYTIAMDIGLRIANVMLCCDILHAGGYLQDGDAFLDTVIRYTTAETRYLLETLEYREGYHSNHYLGNIIGLIFAATHLAGSSETMGWLLFGAQELESCMNQQFMEDGANYEGSTAYHKLCTELMCYGSAFLLARSDWMMKATTNYNLSEWKCSIPLKKNNSDRIFDAEFLSKLNKAGRVLQLFTKPSGEIIQVGDNDSARLFQLSVYGEFINAEEARLRYADHPKREGLFFDENMLGSESVLDAYRALIAGPSDRRTPEFALIRSICDPVLEQIELHGDVTITGNPSESLLKFTAEHRFRKSNAGDLRDGLRYQLLPNFGMVVYHSDRLYLALSFIAGPDLHVSWGHQHNDKLSVVLWMDGEDVLIDPGSYCYTAAPELRNMFRSTLNHNVITVDDIEQNDPMPGSFGLFALKRQTKAALLEVNSTGATAEARYKGIHTVRKINIMADQIVITDWCSRPFQHNFSNSHRSVGYGKLLRG